MDLENRITLRVPQLLQYTTIQRLGRFLLGINWWRWLSIVALGFATRFLVDVIYGLIYRHYEIRWDLQEYILASLLALVLLEGVRWINRRLDSRIPWELNPSRRFVSQLLLDSLFVLFVTYALRLLLIIVTQRYDFLRLWDEVIIAMVAVGITFIIVTIELGIFFLERWRTSLAELERFKKQTVEFKLETLRTQVNPHFLFNSLNTLSSLVYSDQETAHEFIRKLANVYRNVLESRDRDLVSIREELSSLKAYVDLVRLRFAQKLEIEMAIDPKCQDKMVTPLILQMLIENAIKHNVVSTKRPLKIELLTEGNFLVIRNNLQKKSSLGYSSRIGLSNIQSHYEIISDKRLLIEENSSFFTVKIPLL